MTIEQIIVLAVVQGITEFLPISSSGHLILVPNLMHWPDQGQFIDVMVHLGTLLAILIYFWRDVWRITLGALELCKGKVTDDGRLAIYIVLATIPAVAFGLFLKKFDFADLERNVAVVAWNTILYGILMLIADMVGPQDRTMAKMTLGSALVIGVAQALGADPRHEPFRRHHDRRHASSASTGPMRRASPSCSAFRPSPAPACSRWAMRIASGEPITMDAFYCAVLTFFAGLAAIAFLMALIRRMSFLPFVLYRMVLGGFLLVLVYT